MKNLFSSLDEKLQIKCQNNYKDNLEFQKLIIDLQKNDSQNWQLKLKNREKMLNLYFNSYEKTLIKSEKCSQIIQGYRWKIKSELNQLFLTLTKCQHHQKLFWKLDNHYLFADFSADFLTKKFSDIKQFRNKINTVELFVYFENLLNSNRIQNLFLFGAKTTGKTFLTALFCNTFINSLGKKVAFINARKIVFEIKGTWGEKRSIQPFFNSLKNVDLLVIDDLGLENFNNNIRDEFYVNLLKEREYQKRPTIFISNFDLKALEKNYTFNQSKIENLKVQIFIEQIKKNCQIVELT